MQFLDAFFEKIDKLSEFDNNWDFISIHAYLTEKIVFNLPFVIEDVMREIFFVDSYHSFSHNEKEYFVQNFTLWRKYLVDQFQQCLEDDVEFEYLPFDLDFDVKDLENCDVCYWSYFFSRLIEEDYSNIVQLNIGELEEFLSPFYFLGIRIDEDFSQSNDSCNIQELNDIKNNIELSRKNSELIKDMINSLEDFLYMLYYHARTLEISCQNNFQKFKKHLIK